MRWYVASRFKNYRNARALIDALIERDHTITFDWTRTFEFDESGELRMEPEKDLTTLQKMEFAFDDANGALSAQAIALLWVPDMAGAYIEVGMALTRPDISVHVIGCERWTIFYAMPQVTMHDSVEAFLAYVDTYLP